jgi:hypothetical protein
MFDSILLHAVLVALNCRRVKMCECNADNVLSDKETKGRRKGLMRNANKQTKKQINEFSSK